MMTVATVDINLHLLLFLFAIKIIKIIINFAIIATTFFILTKLYKFFIHLLVLQVFAFYFIIFINIK